MSLWHSLTDFKDSANAAKMQEPIVQTDRASISLEIKLAPGPFGLAGNGRGEALIYGKRILNKCVWDNVILVIDGRGCLPALPISPLRNQPIFALISFHLKRYLLLFRECIFS